MSFFNPPMFFPEFNAPVSSAGVFNSSGVLVRTMWSAQANDMRANNPAAAWDGLLDDGVTVAPTGTYTIKLLQNNVQYHWDGAVGNSSPDHTYSVPGVFYHTNFTTFTDMAASATELYFGGAYHERSPTPQVVKIANPQSPRPIVPNDFRVSYIVAMFYATDGVLAYVAEQNGSTDSFVYAVSTTDGPEVRLCLKTPHVFSAGQTYNFDRVQSVCALDISAAFLSDISGLAVQQVGGTVSNYLFVARGQKGQLLTLDKATGATLHTNTTWIFPQRLATNPITGEVWVIHDNTGTISSGTYNNTTGVITLTMAAPVSYGPGVSVHLINLTGTGVGPGSAFENGVFPAIAPTSGTTVTLQTSAGFGTASMTGGNASVGGMIEKLACDSSGNLTSTGVTITSLQNPLALNVTFDGTTLLVCDGGTSHQIKAFKTSDGSVQTAFGTSGVFGTAGGYVNSPAVPDITTLAGAKFMFRNDASNGGSNSPGFVTCVPDGSFWVGDIGNYRYLHYSSGNSPSYIEQIACTSVAYSVRLCRNDETRLFINWLEFKIDYTKPLAPGNGSWTLVNNWWGNMSPTFMPGLSGGGYPALTQYNYVVQNGNFSILQDALTASNGRTYGRVAISNVSYRVFELTATGLRVCLSGDPQGALPFGSAYIDRNFNLWYSSGITAGSTFTASINAFKGFDVNGDPTWVDTGLLPGQGPGQGQALVQFTSQIMPPNTNNGGGSIPEWSHVEALANGVTPIFNQTSAFVQPDYNYHIVGINLPTGQLSIQTHLPNPGMNTNPNPNFGGWNDDLLFLVFGEAPFFNYGNGQGFLGGGPLHFVPGDTHFLTGFRGEDWGGNQVNVWSHWDENGLLLNRFGPVCPYLGSGGASRYSVGTPEILFSGGAGGNINGLFSFRGVPGFAGNSAFGGFTKQGSTYYIFQNDEWYHGGPSRWSITNTSSIQLTQQTVNWNSASFPVLPPDPTDLLAGLPFVNDNLPDGTAGWHRSPSTNLITSGENDPFSVVFTNGTTCSRFNPDITFQTQITSQNASIYRDFPIGGTGDWTLSGTVFWRQTGVKRPGVDPLDSQIFAWDILDNAGKIIVRQFFGYLEDGFTGTWWVNDIVKVQDGTGQFTFNTQSLKAFSIVGHIGTGIINIIWGPYSASVSTPFDPLANMSAPSRVIITNFTIPGNSIGISFGKLKWTRLP